MRIEPLLIAALLLVLAVPVWSQTLPKTARRQPPSLLPRRPDSPGALLHRLLDNRAAGFEELVFAQRVSGRDHWYGSLE